MSKEGREEGRPGKVEGKAITALSVERFFLGFEAARVGCWLRDVATEYPQVVCVTGRSLHDHK